MKIWKSKAPPHKVAFFVGIGIWRLPHERRGITLCKRRYLCSNQEENGSHFCLHCWVTNQLWDMFLSLFKVNFLMPHTVNELLLCCGSKEDTNDRVLWKTIPTCTGWVLWKERNSRSFEGKATSLLELKFRCLCMLALSCKLLWCAWPI